MAGVCSHREHAGAHLGEHRQPVRRVGDHAGPAVGDRRVDADALAQPPVEPLLHLVAGLGLQAPLPRRRTRRGRRRAPRCRPGAAASTRSPSCRTPGTGCAPARPARSRASAAARSAPDPLQLGQQPLDPAVHADDDGLAADLARGRRHAVTGELDRRRVAVQPRAALQHAPREQPAALQRLDRPVAGDEHAVAGRAVRPPGGEPVALQRLELARAVLGLLGAEAGIRSEPTRRTIAAPSSASSRSSSSSDAA